MSNNAAFALGAVFGIAVGMMLEHKLFLREMQDISRQHAAAKKAAPPSTAA